MLRELRLNSINLVIFLVKPECVKIQLSFSFLSRKEQVARILGKIEIMENQCHHSILSDHELEVDGVIYHELKSLNRVVIQDGPDAGKEEQVLVHTRSIGDKDYMVKKINSEETEKVVEENNMTRLEDVEAFQEDWSKNWNPNLGQQEEGGIKGFFKKLLKL